MHKYKSTLKNIMLSLIFLSILLIQNKNNAIMKDENYTNFYFLSKLNNQMDCILLENYDKKTKNKKYALIDTAMNSNIDEMINCLNKKNVKNLDFIVLTHLHSDHAGGIEKLINEFNINRVYIKEFDKIYVKDGIYWQGRYDKILKLCAENNIKIIGPSIFYGESSVISKNERIYNDSYVTEFNNDTTKFKFGSANVQIINWEIQYDENGNRTITEGDNENSLGVLLTQGNKKAFFAGDINNLDGDEDRIASQIGKIDFIKLGHHRFRSIKYRKLYKNIVS